VGFSVDKITASENKESNFLSFKVSKN